MCGTFLKNASLRKITSITETAILAVFFISLGTSLNESPYKFVGMYKRPPLTSGYSM